MRLVSDTIEEMEWECDSSNYITQQSCNHGTYDDLVDCDIWEEYQEPELNDWSTPPKNQNVIPE